VIANFQGKKDLAEMEIELHLRVFVGNSPRMGPTATTISVNGLLCSISKDMQLSIKQDSGRVIKYHHIPTS
jgi:hypothetical protein